MVGGGGNIARGVKRDIANFGVHYTHFLVLPSRVDPHPMYLTSVTTLLRMFNLTNSTIDSMSFYTVRCE